MRCRPFYWLTKKNFLLVKLKFNLAVFFRTDKLFFLRYKAQTYQLKGKPIMCTFGIHTDLPLRRIRQRAIAHKNRFWSDRLRCGAIVCDEVRQNGGGAYV